MKPQRIKYQWFQDVPRHVTKREYNGYQLRIFGSVMLGMLAVLAAIASIFGLTLQPSQELAAVDSLSIADAVAFEGERRDLVKLEGFLVADNPPVMPDEDTRKVIRGRLKLVARGASDSGTDASNGPLKETLFEWEDNAAPVFLSDKEQQIPLAFDVVLLPMADESLGRQPKTIRAGESARTSQPVAIEYNDQRFPLTPEIWGEEDSVFTDLERQVLPYGEAVVVVAGLETTPTGNQLVDPLGDRLQVMIGTEETIRKQGEQTRVMAGFWAIPLGMGSFFLGRSARQLRQEFVERSNRP